jgi:hypothetical protein
MLAADNAYYVVKFRNNPQHPRVLVNELVCYVLLAYLQLPVPDWEIVEVPPELLEISPELVMEAGRGERRCEPGLHFGSRYPVDPLRQAVYDYLPLSLLRVVLNADSFCGMLAFDKWVSNANGRQAVFFRDRARRWLPPFGGGSPDSSRRRSSSGLPRASLPGDLISTSAPRPGVPRPKNAPGPAASSRPTVPDGLTAPQGPIAPKGLAVSPRSLVYVATMIDHGFAFEAQNWSFSDSPERGLYSRREVYENVGGFAAFEPWLDRICHCSSSILDDVYKKIPPEWHGGDWDSLEAMLEQLYRRRGRVPELVRDAKKAGRDPFPNWSPAATAVGR